MHSQERVLARRAMGITAIVERILKTEYGVKWFQLTKEDQIRLLRLVQWQERFRVPVRWILAQLIPFWQQRYTKYRQKKGFGVTIATLVGRASEEILKQRILEQFPENEHLQKWTATEQERQWSKVWDEPSIKTNWSEPRKTLSKYQRRMQEERKERMKFAREQRRRPYRGNPWL